jgi:uncharacterized glyoxalase superfamily protein PhnB
MTKPLTAIELKTYLPAQDFELSKRFYADFGFEVIEMSENMAFCRLGHSSFLLQKYYVKEWAENFMMHLLVEDVESWWQHIQAQQIASRYGVRVLPPEDQPWGLRDFVVDDPTGVLWRIGQDISGRDAASPS